MLFDKIKFKMLRPIKALRRHLCLSMSLRTEMHIRGQIYLSRQKCTFVQSWKKKKKKCDTRCYSDTYHRREMKLVPFFVEKCPLLKVCKRRKLGGSSSYLKTSCARASYIIKASLMCLSVCLSAILKKKI